MDPDRERLIKGRSQKKRKPKSSQSTSIHSNSTSVNVLKSNIRSVSRVLEHAQDLPLDVRIEKERALAGYKQDLEKAQHEKERQRMIKKYHMVRFFGQSVRTNCFEAALIDGSTERQKATRNLKKLRTRLSSLQHNSSEHEALEIDVHNAEVDLNYTLYHPLSQKYASLFPRKIVQGAGTHTATAQARQNKPAMWATVESCMERGTLQALRDGNLPTGDVSSKALQPITAMTLHRQDSKKQKQARQSKHHATPTATEQEDESDGGFFEE
ncbi:MAG: hypothetical protein LQ337_001162 [Flavoplaca oasis]|nr:MAG: hypothetical protein LQ337_001162 [Flavoplaca oasis]